MIHFDTLSETTAKKIFYEVVRTIYNNSEILSYVKSGKADYFGFDADEELWEDCVLFRPHRYAEFVCCIDYIYTLDDRERAERVVYILFKLKTTFRDLENEKILEQVRTYISTFTNHETH